MTGVPEALATSAVTAYQQQASLATTHPVLFNEFTLRNENTGEPIENAPVHNELIDFIERHKRVVVVASPEMGKTQQLVGYMLREIGRDTTGRWRGLVGSKIAANAQKPSRQMMRYIEHSQEFQICFPHVRPGAPWRAEGWKVQGAAFGDPKDMTISTCGVGGSILGSRVNFALLDDIIDWENTRTEYRSDQVVEWILQVLEGRMLAGGKIVLLQNAWKTWDAGHKLVEKYGWKIFRLTARDPVTRKSNWPQVWGQERLDSYPPAVAQQALDAIPPADGASLLDDAWIQACKMNGSGLTMQRALTPSMLPPGAFCVTGVDLNHKKKKTSDQTVLFTLMVIPDDTGRPAWLRPIWIEAGIMSGPEIKAAIRDHYRRYGSRFLVEDNAAQSYIVDDLNLDRPDIVVEPFTTGSNKWHPEYGVGGIATEMSQGLWVIPAMRDPEGGLVCEKSVEEWLRALQRFSPVGHTSDLVMAGWFAWRGARDNFAHAVGLTGADDHVAPSAVHSDPAKAIAARETEALWEAIERLGVDRSELQRASAPVEADGVDDDESWASRPRL